MNKKVTIEIEVPDVYDDDEETQDTAEAIENWFTNKIRVSRSWEGVIGNVKGSVINDV